MWDSTDIKITVTLFCELCLSPEHQFLGLTLFLFKTSACKMNHTKQFCIGPVINVELHYNCMLPNYTHGHCIFMQAAHQSISK